MAGFSPVREQDNPFDISKALWIQLLQSLFMIRDLYGKGNTFSPYSEKDWWEFELTMFLSHILHSSWNGLSRWIYEPEVKAIIEIPPVNGLGGAASFFHYDRLSPKDSCSSPASATTGHFFGSVLFSCSDYHRRRYLSSKCIDLHWISYTFALIIKLA